jgi:hypothetical protein
MQTVDDSIEVSIGIDLEVIASTVPTLPVGLVIGKGVVNPIMPQNAI